MVCANTEVNKTKAEQDCFGAPGQAETSLKIEGLRFNKTTGKRNTLKIVENTK